ncbi:hypothetical protein AAG906_011628 [Vitis piasezkii]
MDSQIVIMTGFCGHGFDPEALASLGDDRWAQPNSPDSEDTRFDTTGKKPSGGQRSGDVGFISSTGMRPPRHYRTVGQTSGFYYPPSPHVQYRPPVPSRPMTPTYLHPVSQPVFAAQTTNYVQRPSRQFAQLGMPLSRAFQKLIEGGLLTPLASRPLPQPIPPRFRMDLHCSYHQGPGHDTDHCTALRHAIQDLIDQGLVNLGQPSVTTNPLPAHSTHAVSPSSGDIHHMDLIEDDSIHMLSWDDGLPEPIVLHDSYEVDGVSLAPFQLTHPTPLVIGCQDAFVPFTLWREDDDSEGREIQIVTRNSYRALARNSIWSLLASSKTHRDALIQALSQIRVETTTTPERLIHMMTGPLASYQESGYQPRAPLYITVGCSGRRVLSSHRQRLTISNVCPLATAIALGFAPSNFGPSTQTVRAYDSTKREVMGTLMIDLQIAGAIPSSLHQKVKFIHDGQVITMRSTRDIFAASEPVLQISHSEDDLLLTGFTFDEIQTLEIEDFCRDFVAMSFDQHSSTVVLDMMRGMTFLPGMGLGRRRLPLHGARKERVRARLSHTPFDYPIRPYRMSLTDYFAEDRRFDLLQLSDGAPDTSFPMAITPTSPDRASMLSLCFLEEITSDGVIVDPTEMIDGVVPHDEYRDEMDMMIVSRLRQDCSTSLFHLICLGCLPLRSLRGPGLFLFQSF